MTITRRTVVRGAAWTAPIVAVAVAAPAFAASVTIPPPVIDGAVVGGKCPGQSTDFPYGFVIPVKLTSPVQTFAVTNVIYNGDTVDACTAPASSVPTDLWAVSWNSTSSANGVGSGTFAYSGTYDNGVNPNTPFNGVGTFSYDGTNPIDNQVRQAVCSAAGNCA